MNESSTSAAGFGHLFSTGAIETSPPHPVWTRPQAPAWAKVPVEDTMPYGMQETAAVEFPRPNRRIVLAARVAHGLISLAFVCCIAILYIDAWRGAMNGVTLVALAALWVEGVLVLMSRGSCPLEPLFHRLGDETPLFELLLPPRAAELVVPALGVVSTLGAVLLGIRTL